MSKIVAMLHLLPAIIGAIKALEAAIPGQGKGEQKLAALREVLETLDSSAKDLWPSIAAVVGVIVKAMNASGALSRD